MDLAQALSVKPSFFFDEPAVSITWIGYRKHASLLVKQQESIAAVAGTRLETEIRLRELFRVGLNHSLPHPFEVADANGAEQCAEAVRSKWKLGQLPINGLIETIEDHGGIVLSWPEVPDFSGRSGWTSNGVPVMVINSLGSTDKRRFDAAHELGHLVMEPTTEVGEYERLAYRFAGAFLVPRELAVHELGVRRQRIALPELGLLKQRWGLSMQAWARRARDLDIINDSLYKDLNIQIRRKGWYRNEPYAYEGKEEPMLLRRLVSRALTEGVISSSDAARISPGCELAESPLSLRELARWPREDRHQFLSGSAWSVDEDEVAEWDAVSCLEDATVENS